MTESEQTEFVRALDARARMIGDPLVPGVSGACGCLTAAEMSAVHKILALASERAQTLAIMAFDARETRVFRAMESQRYVRSTTAIGTSGWDRLELTPKGREYMRQINETP